MVSTALIGIIGGSGIYDPEIFKIEERIKVHTPYGEPSDFISIGSFNNKRVAFLPRHGTGHRIPPHKINYRANIYALAQLGVKWIISVSAVGSLRDDYKPGDLVVPDQFVDMTKKREYTFYDGPQVAHISMADPFCEQLREIIIESSADLGVVIHKRGNYICIEGPRFSTRAESLAWKRTLNGDVIGMTLVPEINLACESQICYATLAMITDYDVYSEHPVTAEEVEKVMKKNVENVKKLLSRIISNIPENPDEKRCSCCKALEKALI
ncbi:S-methyl-5'-thioadenosine phosphorylase [Sulfolobales archaeon HS-7]|nr:S-methyl-5'-thioadenosine phosphorylase [Sulfolobales archaeon HS-7]